MCVPPNNVTLPPFLQMGSASYWCSWCWCIWRWSCSLSFVFFFKWAHQAVLAPACFWEISVAKGWKFHKNEDLFESTQSDFRKALQTSKTKNYFCWRKIQRYPSFSFAVFLFRGSPPAPLVFMNFNFDCTILCLFFISIYTRKLFSYSSSSTLHPCE